MGKRNWQGWGGNRSTYQLFRAVCIAVGLLVAFTTGATAQPPPSVIYSVAGVQTAVTDITSSFVGVAISNDGDFAGWNAHIERTPLSPDPVAGTINGGTFQLDGQLHNIRGTFMEGLIFRESTSCRRETFSVVGTLSLEDPNGSGFFDLTLTHYRFRLGTQCITYFATVEGLVTFSFTSP